MDLMRWARLHWDRLAAWGLVLVGAIALYVGWNGVADTPFPAEQMSYVVSGGIAGGVLIVLGGALLVSADLRDEWHKLDRIETLLRERPDQEPAPEPAAGATATRSRTGSNGHDERAAVRSFAVNRISLLRALSPWAPVETVRLLAVGLGGAVVVGLGWHRLGDEARWDDQISWTALAGVGAVVIGFAAVTWVLRGRTALAERRRALLSGLEESLLASRAATAEAAGVAHPTLGYYHRADCAMAVGRGWPIVARRRMVLTGRRPCAVCEP